jgi:hypothetical protein
MNIGGERPGVPMRSFAGFNAAGQPVYTVTAQNPKTDTGQLVGPNGELYYAPGTLPTIAQGAGTVAGAKKAGEQPFEQANTAFKGQVEAAVAGNKPIPLAPGETVSINPNRVPFPAPMGAAPTQVPLPLGMSAGGALPGVTGAPQPPSVNPPAGTPQPAPGGGVTLQGLPIGQKVAEETRAKEEQTVRQANIDAASGAQSQQATLQTLKAEAPNFYQGPFANHYQQAASFLRLIDPSFTGQVASYEDFTKNAGQLTRQAVKETSPRAAVQEFKLISAALPNPEMSPVGLGRVINEYMGLNDYRVAKAQAQQIWEQQHGGPGNVTGFETHWQGAVSPYAFVAMRMEPGDLKAMLSHVASQKGGAEELARLRAQMNYIDQNGLDKFR